MFLKHLYILQDPVDENEEYVDSPTYLWVTKTKAMNNSSSSNSSDLSCGEEYDKDLILVNIIVSSLNLIV